MYKFIDMEKQILQDSLRLKFDSYMNESQARYFNELVTSLNKTYKFDKDWLENLIGDYEFHYNSKWVN
jgi:hypothetical protein